MEVVATIACVCVSCQGRKRCPRCHGSGRIVLSTMGFEVALTYEECHECQGTGACVLCNGDGKRAWALFSRN